MALIKKARQLFEFSLEKPFDVAICGVGFPKDVNLYQTTRPASYLFYLPTRVVKNGGYVILPAKCEEGAGKGIGEKRFFDLLKNKTIDEILNLTELKAGEQRAFLMANVLKYWNVIIVGSNDPEIIKNAKLIPAKDMDEAFSMVKNDLGSKIDVLIIPDPFQTFPIIN